MFFIKWLTYDQPAALWRTHTFCQVIALATLLLWILALSSTTQLQFTVGLELWLNNMLAQLHQQAPLISATAWNGMLKNAFKLRESA